MSRRLGRSPQIIELKQLDEPLGERPRRRIRRLQDVGNQGLMHLKSRRILPREPGVNLRFVQMRLLHGRTAHAGIFNHKPRVA